MSGRRRLAQHPALNCNTYSHGDVSLSFGQAKGTGPSRRLQLLTGERHSTPTGPDSSQTQHIFHRGARENREWCNVRAKAVTRLDSTKSAPLHGSRGPVAPRLWSHFWARKTAPDVARKKVKPDSRASLFSSHTCGQKTGPKTGPLFNAVAFLLQEDPPNPPRQHTGRTFPPPP